MDIARGIGILLVVLGHVTKNEFAVKLIYSFHMPLFFFLSGYLFNQKRYIVRSFVIRKAKNLLIPYLFFYLLTLGVHQLVEVRVSGEEFSWWSLLPLVLGSNVNGLMSHNIVLWFLPALFSTEVLFRVLSEWIKRRFMPIAVGICAGVGLVCYSVGITWLPMGLNVALIAIVFFGIGHWLKTWIDTFSSRRGFSAVLFACCTALLLFAAWKGWVVRIDMASGHYGNFILFLLWAMTGIVMIVSFSLFLNKVKWLEYLGHSDTSLVIMCFHGIILRAVLFVTVLMTGWDLAWVRNQLGISLVVTLVVVLICMPLVWGYGKYVKRIYAKL